jgi:hypothetical protein
LQNGAGYEKISGVLSAYHIAKVKQGKWFMESKRKNGTKTETQNVVGSTRTCLQEKPEKSGFLKRFLDWIAKGAKEANMGAQSCPT